MMLSFCTNGDRILTIHQNYLIVCQINGKAFLLRKFMRKMACQGFCVGGLIYHPRLLT